MNELENKNDLVEIINNKIVVSSIQVAKRFEKKHKVVLRSLSTKLCSANGDRLSSHFFKDYYKDVTGKRNTIYYMDRDGFSFLVMGFTGDKADAWKLDFIDAFNEMEAKLKRLHDIELGRLIERAKSKEVRRSLTDVIRDDYPESPHKKFVYKNFTDLAYKNVFGFNAKQLRNKLGITKKENIRDCFSQSELKQLQERETLIKELVKSGYSYKQVKDILSMKYIDGGISCLV